MPKIKNSTDFPTFALRRMLSWCIQQTEDLKVRELRQADFRNRFDMSFSGRAYCASRRIVVSAGFPVQYNAEPPSGTPAVKKTTEWGEEFWFPSYPHHADERWMTFVRVTAHEVFHVWAYLRGKNTRNHWRGRGSSEAQTERFENAVAADFRANRAELLAKWTAEPERAVARPAMTAQQKRAAKVDAKLEEWSRKLKTAERKVKEYRKKQRYYDRALGR